MQTKAKRRILRRQEVIDIVGLKSSTIYRKISEGDFPAPINLGTRTVGWIESEIDAWLESRTRMVPRALQDGQEAR